MAAVHLFSSSFHERSDGKKTQHFCLPVQSENKHFFPLSLLIPLLKSHFLRSLTLQFKCAHSLTFVSFSFQSVCHYFSLSSSHFPVHWLKYGETNQAMTWLLFISTDFFKYPLSCSLHHYISPPLPLHHLNSISFSHLSPGHVTLSKADIFFPDVSLDFPFLPSIL